LGNALGVAGMLAMKDVDGLLAGIVSEQVKTEPDRIWKDLLSNPPLN